MSTKQVLLVILVASLAVLAVGVSPRISAATPSAAEWTTSTRRALPLGSNCDTICSTFANLQYLTSLLSSQTVVNVGGKGA